MKTERERHMKIDGREAGREGGREGNMGRGGGIGKQGWRLIRGEEEKSERCVIPKH